MIGQCTVLGAQGLRPLQQVIMKLWSTITAQPRGRLVGSRQDESDQVLVEVKDAGVGIAPKT
jgi:C4-dicarboxylate-specific signal transduction histidine kinase